MDVLIKEWQSLKLGDITWPFSQGAFDEFVQRVNSEKENGFVKDEKVKVAAVKYRRIKEINTVRNDFIETLIFEKNGNILPTLNHRRGVDFFINGISFDQKWLKVQRMNLKDILKMIGGKPRSKNQSLLQNIFINTKMKADLEPIQDC